MTDGTDKAFDQHSYYEVVDRMTKIETINADLLEALERRVKICRIADAWDSDGRCVCNICKEDRAAIAKARP